MADDRPLIEQILDVAIYAPIGAAVAAAEQVPALVGKGRSAIEGQVTVARMLGRLTVGAARKKLDETLAARWPSTPTADAEGAESEVSSPGSFDEDADHSGPDAEVYDLMSSRPSADATPPVDTLAIPGYDSLAASQVVPRLDSLSGEELAAVLAYERGTRRRRTIINRILQLSDSAAR